MAFLVVNLGVSVAATLKFGLVGPLLGTLSGFVAISSWAMPRVLKQEFEIHPSQLYGAATRPLLIGVPYCVFIGFLARNHTARGWFGLGAEMAAAAFGGVVIWWFTGIPGRDRKLWKGRLATMRAAMWLREDIRGAAAG